MGKSHWNVFPTPCKAELCEDLNLQTSHLMPHDFLVLISGTNDIKANENGTVEIPDNLEQLENLISHKGHVNISIMSTPRRYDQELLNSHIDKYNDEVKELCRKNNITFIDVNSQLKKEDFTNHGLHLNSNGKNKIADIILKHTTNQEIQDPSFQQ